MALHQGEETVNQWRLKGAIFFEKTSPALSLRPAAGD
jgi:hypothetical protein